MSREPIRHAAWPTGVPPVPTYYWDQVSWDKWAEGFRPAGYTGGMFDLEAYRAFDEQRRLDVWNELRAGWQLPPLGLDDLRRVEARPR